MKPDDVQKLFSESKALALSSKQTAQETLDPYLESRKRCTIKFKPIADVIREVEIITDENGSVLKFIYGDGYAEMIIENSSLNVASYEELNNLVEYSGEYKYHIYCDQENFSLHFNEDELNKVTYLIVKMIADYEVYGTIPRDTFYYKLNMLHRTPDDHTATRERLNREMMELMTSNDRKLFKPII